MVKCYKLVTWLDSFLKIDDIKDYFENGLQVPGKEEVKKIALAVDPCLDVIEKVLANNFDMLIVHHPVLRRSAKLFELDRRRLKLALAADLNIYCSHLPLDRHSVVGNNVSLAKILGLEVKGDFGENRNDGKFVGCWAEFDKPKPFEEFEAIVKDKLKVEVKAKKFGSDSVQRVGFISGGGGYHVKEASVLGLDTVLVGDFSHHAILEARDIGVNLVMAGHYGSEKLGVQELGKVLKEKFPEVQVEFVDNPTGF